MKYAAHQGIRRVSVALQIIHYAYLKKTQNFAALRDIQNCVESIVARLVAFAVMKKTAVWMKASVAGSSAARLERNVVEKIVVRRVYFVATKKAVARTKLLVVGRIVAPVKILAARRMPLKRAATKIPWAVVTDTDVFLLASPSLMPLGASCRAFPLKRKNYWQSL